MLFLESRLISKIKPDLSKKSELVKWNITKVSLLKNADLVKISWHFDAHKFVLYILADYLCMFTIASFYFTWLTVEATMW